MMVEPIPTDVATALRLAAEAQEHRKAAEVAEVIALAQAARLYEVDAGEVEWALQQLLSMRTDVPGVGEFLALEAAAVLGMSPSWALFKLQKIMSIQHRHPFVWEAFCGGELWWWQATYIEHACRELSTGAAREVDRMLSHAVRTMPWWQAVDKVEQLVKVADPEHARRQQLLLAQRRDVRVERLEHGHARFWGTLSARDAMDFDHAITERAKLLPSPELPDTMANERYSAEELAAFRAGVKRSMAVGELARAAFGQDALPTHQLVVHIDADDPALDPEAADTGAAIIESWGTMLTEDLPALLQGCKVIVRPVVDVRKMADEDRHDPSANLRFAIQQRDPFEVFPHGSTRSTSCDLDHTDPYRDDGTPGQTGPGNLGPLSRRVHRAKTFGGFHVTQPAPGYFHWRTPHGWEFLVGPRGTTKLTDPPRRRPPAEPPEPWDPYLNPPEQPAEKVPPERAGWAIAQHTLFHYQTAA